MKVAIIHNYLDNIGGAQVALFTLARELNADVYSPVADPAAIAAMGFTIPVHRLGPIPANPPWRQQVASIRLRRLNLGSHYDAYILAGDWTLSAAVHNKPNIWWCHSPSRELWDLHRTTRQTSVPPYQRPIYDLWVRYNRHQNRRYLPHVTSIIASSRNAQGRIKKYFGRSAHLIYPPVDTADFYPGRPRGYWLSVNRLVAYKRIELQLAAWAKMPGSRLLIVAADEPARHFQRYRHQLDQLKPANVTFLPPQSRAKLLDLYAHAEGFITTSHQEDFGLTAVEAMAAGKAVVAPNEGGYRETVIDSQTGHLINASPDSIIKTVNLVAANPDRYRDASLKQAKKFDTAVTVSRFKQQLEQLIYPEQRRRAPVPTPQPPSQHSLRPG